MADTRCANPEYQLDVDEMMLDYLLYNTSQAHIGEFNHRHGTPGAGEDTTTQSASRLLQIFDTTIRTFKANHPQCQLPPKTKFDLSLLEFLLLFIHARGGPGILSPSAIAAARQDGVANLDRRKRRYLAYLVPFSHHESHPEREVFELWSAFKGSQRAEDEEEEEARGRVALMDLVPRFMGLSAEVANLMGEYGVSQMWLELATDFMLQAALEGYLELGWDGTDALMGCFGWGLGVREDGDMEMDGGGGGEAETQDMERMVEEMLAPDALSGSQETQWVDWRRNTLLRFRPPDGIGGLERSPEELRVSCQNSLNALRNEHPVSAFEARLVAFIQGLQWVGTQAYGEPILLQIEQGRLEGLDDGEFRALMERIGSDEHDERVANTKL